MVASGGAVALPRRRWADAPIGSSSLFGVLTLVASVYVLSVVPEFLVRFCLWLLTHTIYRIRIDGPGARAVARTRAARLQSPVARRRRAGRRVHPAVRPVPRLQARTTSTGRVNPLLRMMHAIPVARRRARRSRRSTPRAASCRTATSSASSPRARSAAPATCCRSSAGSSGSSTASTCRSCRSISIASGAASSASRADASSGSGRRAFPIR